MVERADYYGTGRRKTSVSRVHLRPGTGKITINGEIYDSLREYFQRDTLVMEVNKPFTVTDTAGQFDVICRISGGGLSGQAGALKLGISRALLNFNDSLRKTLRENELLTRDPRMVERKKYGKKKARKSPQFSKR